MTRKRCPKCGSANVKRWGVPQTWSKWECQECGYIGAVIIIEDGKIGFDKKGMERKERNRYREFQKRGKQHWS